MSDTQNPGGWDGRPENPEQDSDGHVWRVDGVVDVYRWVAADQWYRDHKDRWVSPIDLIEEGDTYFGRIVPPAEVAAQVAAAERRGIERAVAEVDCGCLARESVLVRLRVTDDYKKASYLCSNGDTCCALQAAAIRALLEDGR